MKNRGLLLFSLKALVLLSLVAVIDKSIGIGFNELKNIGLEVNPECRWLKTPYSIEKVDSDVLIIGSSRAQHNYVTSCFSDSLECSVYNCGQDGCFFLFQNCLINMILERYQPKMIVWDVQPNCFDENEKMDEYSNKRYLTPYYNNEFVQEYVNKEDKWMKWKMKSSLFANNSMLLFWLFPILDKNTHTMGGYEPLPANGYAYPTLQTIKKETSQFQANEKMIADFEETIESCTSSGIRLVIVISPSYMVFSDKYKQAVMKITEVAKRNQIEVFDYSEVFLNSPSYFKDGSHLNEHGAAKFSELVISGIKESNLE